MDANVKNVTSTGEEQVRAWLREAVKAQPIVAVAAAGALGAVLGGVAFSRIGRLAFIAAAGYVANELWHREGRLDMGDVIERLSRRA